MKALIHLFFALFKSVDLFSLKTLKSIFWHPYYNRLRVSAFKNPIERYDD